VGAHWQEGRWLSGESVRHLPSQISSHHCTVLMQMKHANEEVVHSATADEHSQLLKVREYLTCIECCNTCPTWSQPCITASYVEHGI
jgi:hypothetical protein